MAVLSESDRQRLDDFFQRALELHAGGAATTDSAVEYLRLVVLALDEHTPEAVQDMLAVVEDAWREDDG